MRFTRRRSSLFGLTSFLIVAGLALPAAGQGRDDPDAPLSRDLVSTSRPLTASEEDRVRAFTAFQLNVLSDGDVDSMIEARNAIIKTTTGPDVTGVFLRSFSNALVPGIQRLLERDSGTDQFMRAENGLRILAFLHTPEALALLIETTDPDRCRDEGRRLVAAGLVPVAIEEGLGAAVLVSTARDLAENLLKEPSWLVVLEELRGINAIALSPDLTEQNRATVRTMQFDTYARLANAIAADANPDPKVKAIYRAMLGLRERLRGNALAGDVSNQQIASTLREMLKRVGAAAVKQWDGLTRNRGLFVAYEGCLRVGSQLLSLLEGDIDRRMNALAAPMSAVLEGDMSTTEGLASLKKAVSALN
ncbi:MAG: hypothetical protein VX672_03400 [Planctomycetota bacterium]|nr:hypothetical protein [Planctomycetota bacterium]